MFSLFFFLIGCKETIEPDGIWTVTVTGQTTDCVDSSEGFLKDYEYSLFYDGTFVEIKVDGENFATGEIRGCALSYESAVYLEENASGNFRWQINGAADIEGAAGGCGDVPDNLDWFGTETLTVVSSENDSVEVDCQYEMTTEGVVQQ